ncbi:hypothetical protein CYLTODRAFT_494451 [Cylindrobasidium torrendii FP15055 ss-10]|uniref:BZIP domain-containing protein n=1 Tax=Cylindrobasidium torrendii FP15055 ss-10 TaxID=1314674 RepID=A0A0D7AWG9_9AGAR|nr:hypothetical protein CYLTODRAFT_494451 [Cylindrobasidium torrendii FP15055 ss-10]
MSSTTVSDFLNTELFGSPSSSSSGSSPASSAALQTPPQSTPLASFENDLYGDNFGAFTNDLNVQSDLFNFMKAPAQPSFDDFMRSLQANTFESLGIDPSLMNSGPAPPSAPQAAQPQPQASTSTLPSIEPVKAGGLGDKARKGTVSGGGVTKKAAPKTAPKRAAKVAVQEKENDEEDEDDDDGEIPASWRPAPEVYAKMSSKEKRQLRNKISARNFRLRRKEYISTLELDIAERDRLLGAIRSELGSTQSENQALRREIEALKNALVGSSSSPMIKEEQTAMFDWASITAPSAAVHTILMPEWNTERVAAKHAPENMNPALNTPPPPQDAKVSMNGFEGFAEGNAFTLKNLDSYRMQLWTKMAQNHTVLPHTPSPTPSPRSTPSPQHSPMHTLPDPRFSPSPFTNPSLPLPSTLSNFALPGPFLTGSPTLHGLASQMGVKYFRGEKQALSPLGSVFSGKPSAKPSQGKKSIDKQSPTPEQAIVATLAHQTLAKRLGGAFWEAFSGTPASTGEKPAPMDVEKVRKVLEGSAVVRVVDVAPAKKEPVVMKKEVVVKKEAVDPLCALLEESMRSLTISKK